MKSFLSGLFALLFLFAFVACDDDATEELVLPEDPVNQLRAGVNEVSFTSETVPMVGDLYLPTDYDGEERLPAVIVSGPWTQVKEQVGATYATPLTEEGFAVLAFDHRYWGESGGEPRYLESATAKSVDIRNAVTYLRTLDNTVDPDRIGVLGVCAGVGNVSLAAAEDDRIHSVATVSPWVQQPSTTPFFYGGEEGVAERIALSQEAEATYAETGEMPTVDAYDPEGNGAAMFFPVDYYGNPQRGAIPEWENRFAVASWQEWLELNTIDIAARVNQPTYIYYGDETFLPDNIQEYYEALPGEKSIDSVVGEHTEFYDLTGGDPTRNAVTRVAEHFRSTL